MEPYPSHWHAFASTIIISPGRQRRPGVREGNPTQVHGPGSRWVPWDGSAICCLEGRAHTSTHPAPSTQTFQTKPSSKISIQFHSAPLVTWVHFVISCPLPIPSWQSFWPDLTRIKMLGCEGQGLRVGSRENLCCNLSWGYGLLSRDGPDRNNNGLCS